MLAERSRAENSNLLNPLSPRALHFQARAKRVIFLFMDGGPSHTDSFDWKPDLARIGGDASSQYLAPVFPFKPRGESGIMISDAFPLISQHADDLRLLNGMHTNNPGHQQAVEGQMRTHDLHATNLHFLGLDHTRLTYSYSGRDFRLTDVAGNIAHDIIA